MRGVLMCGGFQDNYLLEIRGDVREGLTTTEESGESLGDSNEKVYYVIRELQTTSLEKDIGADGE
jgi:hypothetical protein